MFIVIEGLDGTGKTTTAKLLAARLNGEFFPWLQPPFDQILPVIWENNMVSEASKHIAFLAAFKHLSDIINSATYRRKLVVTDRYYFCSLAIHDSISRIANQDPLDFDRKALCFKEPDFAFYLTLDEATRRERLAQRGKPQSAVEAILEQNPSCLEQTAGNYKLMVEAGDMMQLETDDLSPDAIVERIAVTRHINPWCPRQIGLWDFGT